MLEVRATKMNTQLKIDVAVIPAFGEGAEYWGRAQQRK